MEFVAEFPSVWVNRMHTDSDLYGSMAFECTFSILCHDSFATDGSAAPRQKMQRHEPQRLCFLGLAAVVAVTCEPTLPAVARLR